MDEETAFIFTALNFSGAGDLPESVELLPAGRTVRGIDGRQWTNPGNDKLIADFNRRGLQMPIDINHSTELQGQRGGPSPAEGWVDRLFDEGGVLKGRVNWNESAKKSVGKKQYKYLSPVFVHNRAGGIVGLRSAALVNKPNLNQLKSLNHEQGESMKKIAEVLGLNAQATEEEILTALNAALQNAGKGGEQTAMNMADYIPRADYDMALNRAEKAETALAERNEAEFKTALNAALDTAVKEGKIAPASREYYTGTVRNAEDLEAFKKFTGDAAPVVAANAQAPEGSPEEGTALNAEQSELAAAFGLSEEEAKERFLKD